MIYRAIALMLGWAGLHVITVEGMESNELNDSNRQLSILILQTPAIWQLLCFLLHCMTSATDLLPY